MAKAQAKEHSYRWEDTSAVLIEGYPDWIAVEEGSFIINHAAIWLNERATIFSFVDNQERRVEGLASRIIATRGPDHYPA